jgi:hypothetical protein
VGNGLLIDAQAPAESAATLMRLLENPDFALTLAQNGQATFQTRFSDAGGEILFRVLLSNPQRDGPSFTARIASHQSIVQTLDTTPGAVRWWGVRLPRCGPGAESIDP